MGDHVSGNRKAHLGDLVRVRNHGLGRVHVATEDRAGKDRGQRNREHGAKNQSRMALPGTQKGGSG